MPKPLRTWFSLATDTCVPLKPRKRYNLPAYLRQTIKQLKHHPQLRFVPTDKNLGPSILLQQQYLNLGISHLEENTHAYIQILCLDLETVRKKVITFHKILIRQFPDLKRDGRIIIHSLSSQTTGTLRLLPKLHKRDNEGNWNKSIRPIISSKKSVTYGLSKWTDYFLQPILLKSETYLKDSQQLLDILKTCSVRDSDQLVTLDASSLYTSIPLKNLLKVMRIILRHHYLSRFLLQAITIILFNNFFTFSNHTYKQITGIAMGTPVAPTLASLYLAYYEFTYIQSSKLWKKEIVLFTRYIDDLLILWRPSCNTAKEHLFALLDKEIGISWNVDSNFQPCASFLDLSLELKNNKIITRTHQKALNLYLYIPRNSSHPPHSLLGLITGLLKKYYLQNTYLHDFYELTNRLLRRLFVRGYPIHILEPIFQQVLSNTASLRTPSLGRKFFLKLPYDPNGPTPSSIYSSLNLQRLQNLLHDNNLGRVFICYKRSSNLRDILCRFPSELSANHNTQ